VWSICVAAVRGRHGGAEPVPTLRATRGGGVYPHPAASLPNCWSITNCCAIRDLDIIGLPKGARTSMDIQPLSNAVGHFFFRRFSHVFGTSVPPRSR
jgi:hypothetical protein